jgi:hypothetical protein
MPGARRGRGVRPVVGWVSIGWAPDGRGSYGPFNTERPSMPPFSPPHACFAGFCDQHAEQDPPARAGFLFVFSCLKRSRRELAYVHAMRRAARRLAVIRHLGTLGCGGERRFSSPIKPKRKCWLGAPAGGMVLRNSPKAGSRTLRKLAHSRSLVAVSSCELTFAPTAHHRATTSVS